jgi:hypothetical protein
MRIEIGTCDFETEAGRIDGLFIEPVPYYFDRLPATCLKENVAISNYTGTADLYYIPADTIAAHGLDDWLRGCNALGRVHPTVQRMIDGGRLQPDWVCLLPVPVVRIKSLVDKYNITEVEHLKIDTEGHDAIIVNDWLDTVDVRPRHISFEHNGLVPLQDVTTVVLRLEQRGYRVLLRAGQCDAFLAEFGRC